MALKKSELQSFLWASCDALRGGMDASQYKDYVLSLLFIKNISDKYSGVKFARIAIPKGADFTAIMTTKGKNDIGDQITRKSSPLWPHKQSVAAAFRRCGQDKQVRQTGLAIRTHVNYRNR